MSTIYSYDLNGKKLSFANWVSNLSPEETPFCSMTKKEKVNQTMFQWQTDYLRPSGVNAKVEGHAAAVDTLRSTTEHHNYTQILRKVVKVSDTADSIASYGRGEELFYQTEKAGKELKRDLEWAFLNNINAAIGSGTVPRETAGVQGLAASKGTADPATGAVTHIDYFGNDPDEQDVTEMMYSLYLAGSQANTIMYHPSHAAFFSSLQELNKVISGVTVANRVRLFEHTDKLDLHVDEIVSPWCQRFKLVPNRWMPKDAIYFFNPKDFTQMVLREPVRTKMAKAGSSEKILLEMEAGLRLTNPFAVGVLKESDHAKRHKREILEKKRVNNVIVSGVSTIVSVPIGATLTAYAFIKSLLRLPADDNHVDFTIYKDGRVLVRHNDIETDGDVDIVIHNTFSAGDAGKYKIVTDSLSYYDEDFEFEVIVDTTSSVKCSDGDYIKAAHIDGLDLKDTNVSVVGVAGLSVEFKVEVKDTAYAGTASLVKANLDGSNSVLEIQNLDSGSATFRLSNLNPSHAGEYFVVISVDNCVQTSNTIILNVKQPTVPYPFKPGTVTVNSWVLQEGVNTTLIELNKSGDDIEIAYELFDEYAGSNVELVTSLWGKAIHVRKGIAGKDIYSVPISPNGEQQYMLRLNKGNRVFLSPSFSVKVHEPVTPPTPAPPVVTDIFEAQNSYVGGSGLHESDKIIVCTTAQLTIGQSTFFAILENDTTGSGAVYQIFDTASAPHNFTLTQTSSQPAGSGYTYRYFGIPTMKLGDAGKYTLRATKGSSIQNTPPFTLALYDPSNLIP